MPFSSAHPEHFIIISLVKCISESTGNKPLCLISRIRGVDMIKF